MGVRRLYRGRRGGVKPVTFHGDLSSISFPDLLQNLEGSGNTGNLAITREEHEVATLRFEAGKIAMLVQPDRPSLPELLVRQGCLSDEQLRSARSKRRGSRKSLCETLALQHGIELDAVKTIAARALTEDICDLVAEIKDGEFHFDAGPPPPRHFDTEERQLDLRLSVSALVLEGARRADHWRLIRQAIPFDATHYAADPGTIAPLDAGDAALAKVMIATLDGTRSVCELIATIPDRRFEGYCVLAYLVQERIVRATEGDGLLRMARSIAKDDPARSRVLLERGLESEPHHVELLRLHAEVARVLKDRSSAAQSLKTLAHLASEAGDDEQARQVLEEARALAPRDPAILERAYHFALHEKRYDDARVAAMKLVELHRKPGLHNKAHDVLAELVKHLPDDVELIQELAQCQSDAGNIGAAVKILTRSARTFIAAENYADAKVLYESTLELDPQHYEASERLQDIATFAFSRWRARRRRWLSRTAAILTITATVYGGVLETRARKAFAEAQTRVSDQHLVENRRYDEAVRLYEAIREQHQFTPTAWFDIPQKLVDLQSRASESQGPD